MMCVKHAIIAKHCLDGFFTGAEHEQTTKSSSSYVASHQQQSHEASTDYNYTNATLSMTPADSTVPPIVSPTGELIQPGPSSYSKQALSSMFRSFKY